VYLSLIIIKRCDIIVPKITVSVNKFYVKK